MKSKNMLRQVAEAVIRLKTQINPSERLKKTFRSTPINNLTLITSTDNSMRFNYWKQYWKHLKEENTAFVERWKSASQSYLDDFIQKSPCWCTEARIQKKLSLSYGPNTVYLTMKHSDLDPECMPLDVQITETNPRRFCGICKHLSKSGMFVSGQLEFQMLFCDTVLSRREFTGMLCIVSMERDRTSPSSYSSLSFHYLGYK